RADLQRAEAVGDLADEAVVDALLDEKARARRAGLAGVLDDGVDDDGESCLLIRVGEDELSRLAAELQRHRPMVPRRRLLHQRADLGRAGEGDVVDARMAGERRPRLLAEARNDVEGAGRKPDLE